MDRCFGSISPYRKGLENWYNELCDSFDRCYLCPYYSVTWTKGCDEDEMDNTQLLKRIEKMANALHKDKVDIS